MSADRGKGKAGDEVVICGALVFVPLSDWGDAERLSWTEGAILVELELAVCGGRKLAGEAGTDSIYCSRPS